MLERARQFARKAWFLVRYCTVGVPLSPTVDSFGSPPLDHEWRATGPLSQGPGATIGVDRWEYRHRGVRLATIYRMTRSEIDEREYERFGAKTPHEMFRIEWEDDPHTSQPMVSYCGNFDIVRAMCRIHARVWVDD